MFPNLQWDYSHSFVQLYLVSIVDGGGNPVASNVSRSISVKHFVGIEGLGIKAQNTAGRAPRLSASSSRRGEQTGDDATVAPRPRRPLTLGCVDAIKNMISLSLHRFKFAFDTYENQKNRQHL